MAFRMDFRTKFVPPREDEPPLRFDFDHLTGITDPAVRNHEFPGSADFPLATLGRADPELPREFGLNEGLPEPFRRRADIDHVDELRARLITHHAPPIPSLIRSAP